jgi:hypothetical protein
MCKIVKIVFGTTVNLCTFFQVLDLENCRLEFCDVCYDALKRKAVFQRR